MDGLIIEIISKAYQRVVPEKGIPDSKASLLPGAGELDSREFVSFVVTVEELLEQEFNQPFVLLDEAAFSASSSPFRNVDSFAEFISTQLVNN